MSASFLAADPTNIQLDAAPTAAPVDILVAGSAIVLCVLSVPATIWTGGGALVALGFTFDALLSSNGYMTMVGLTELASSAGLGLRCLLGALLSGVTVVAAVRLLLYGERRALNLVLWANVLFLLGFGVLWNAIAFALALVQTWAFERSIGSYGEVSLGPVLDPTMAMILGFPLLVSATFAVVGIVVWAGLAVGIQFRCVV